MALEEKSVPPSAVAMLKADRFAGGNPGELDQCGGRVPRIAESKERQALRRLEDRRYPNRVTSYETHRSRDCATWGNEHRAEHVCLKLCLPSVFLTRLDEPPVRKLVACEPASA